MMLRFLRECSGPQAEMKEPPPSRHRAPAPFPPFDRHAIFGWSCL